MEMNVGYEEYADSVGNKHLKPGKITCGEGDNPPTEHCGGLEGSPGAEGWELVSEAPYQSLSENEGLTTGFTMMFKRLKP
jgi:hypothetical protein